MGVLRMHQIRQQEQKSELRIAKQVATDIPALILLRQEGKKKMAGVDASFGGQS